MKNILFKLTIINGKQIKIKKIKIIQIYYSNNFKKWNLMKLLLKKIFQKF